MDCLSNTYQEQSANWGGQVAPQSNKDVQFYDQGIARRTERDTMEKERFGENGVIGSSPAMRRILDEVKIVALDGLHSAHTGRNRDRKGTHCEPHPQIKPPLWEELHPIQLRSFASRVDRECALR